MTILNVLPVLLPIKHLTIKQILVNKIVQYQIVNDACLIPLFASSVRKDSRFITGKVCASFPLSKIAKFFMIGVITIFDVVNARTVSN